MYHPASVDKRFKKEESHGFKSIYELSQLENYGVPINQFTIPEFNSEEVENPPTISIRDIQN